MVRKVIGGLVLAIAAFFLSIAVSLFLDGEIIAGLLALIVTAGIALIGIRIIKGKKRSSLNVNAGNANSTQGTSSYIPTALSNDTGFVDATSSPSATKKSDDDFQEKNEAIDVVVFDTETTGLSPSRDELLQFSAVDGDGKTLLNTYIKPMHHAEWDGAMQVNGITPEMVATAPTFDELLPAIQDIMNRARIIVGFNTDFDVSFLEANGCRVDRQKTRDVMWEAAPIIGEKDEWRGGFKPPTLVKLAKCYGYEFKAHDALEDAKATLYCFNKVENGEAFVKDPATVKIAKKRYNTRRSDQTKALLTLEGLIDGMLSDDELTEDEVLQLNKWLDDHSDLKGNYPYDRIAASVQDALEDGVLEPHERDEMFRLFKEYLDPQPESTDDIGLFSLVDKNVVITGEFEYGSRNEVEAAIQKLGGTIKSGVSGKVHYVIVGELGSPDWSHGNYGSKIKKAKELQEQGKDIRIIAESDIESYLRNA